MKALQLIARSHIRTANLYAPAQGHSKNPSRYRPDGLGAVLAEVFAGFGDGEAALADEEYGGVTQCGQRAGTRADAAAILVKRNIAHMMKPVFDRPMVAIEFEETLGAGFLRRQARNEIGGLDAVAPLDMAMALDAHGLRRPRPAEIRRHFRTGCDFADFDPAMILVDGLGLAQIRRRAAGGKGRRRLRRCCV